MDPALPGAVVGSVRLTGRGPFTDRYRQGASRFPPPSSATAEGIVAAGAAPEPELLKDAYLHGIFPWPHEGLPLLWFSPDPRFVIDLDEVHLPRSLRKSMRRGTYTIRFDSAFGDVMQRCGEAPRPGQGGTWITPDMLAGYVALHREGIAHSVEAWRDGTLVGGLYGVSFGAAFFGESMFADAPDASKVAFGTLLAQLRRWGFLFVDCQVYTDHLDRFGAFDVDRDDYLAQLETAVARPTRLGPWRLEINSADAVEILREPRRPQAEDGASDADIDDETPG